jgi:hypothetical protein
MDHVPITFECNGKKYSVHFAAVHGAGSNVWHLMDNKGFYLGRLRQARGEWVFDNSNEKKNPCLGTMTDYFADFLVNWYE